MPLTGMTVGTLLGLAISGAFALLCRRDMERAVLAFVLLGWIPFVRMFELAGEHAVQNLLLVEALPTVMVVVWWLGRARALRPSLVRAGVNRPLALMVPVALLSFVWTLGGADPNVPTDHVKVAVSLGQILLIAWPVGLYFVSANAISDTATMRSIVKAVVVMAIPSLVISLLPMAWRNYIGWSVYFGLVASPVCFAASFDTRRVSTRLGLWVLAAAPLVHGILIGKAFLYLTIATSLAVVALIRSRRTLLTGALVLLSLYFLSAAMTGSLVPRPIQELIDVERQQQSLGGRAGRLALAADTLEIWARYPIFGVGPGNSWPYMHRYSVIDTPHNQYLLVLLELGIVGLACFLWFVVEAFRIGLDAIRNLQGRFHRTLAIGWFGLFCGMVMSGLTGDFIFHSIRNGGLEMFTGYYLQWVFLGMVVSAIEIERGRQ